MRGVHPPGPRGVPILGSLLAVRRDPTGVFLDAARRFGDVVSFKIGPRRGYLISNPHDVRHVLLDNARNYHKSPLYDKLRAVLGNGLLTSEDAFWLRQRRIAQPAFHHQRIAGLAGVMAHAARETAERWKTIASETGPVDIDEDTLQKIADVTGGKYYRADNARRFEAIYEEIDKLEKTEAEVRKYTQFNDLFPWLISPGLGLLLLELVLRHTLLRRLP